MRVQAGEMVPLGYGKYVLSDEVIAVEAIGEGRGPGRRARVWVRGIAEPLIASRSEEAVIADLVAPGDAGSRLRQQRSALQLVAKTLDAVPPVLRRVLREESGVDLDGLSSEVRRLLD
jgi:hypothetical protein